MGGPERRVFVRIDCNAPLIVSLHAAPGHARNLVGQVRNVSEGGALLLLPERLPRDARVTLIHLPAEDRPNAPASSVEARVAWSTETPNATLQFQHGVNFVSPAAHLVTALLALKA